MFLVPTRQMLWKARPATRNPYTDLSPGVNPLNRPASGGVLGRMERHRGWALLMPALVAAVILGGSAARASCAGPPPGETPRPPSGPIFVGRLLAEVGEGTSGRLFEFDVESVERGEIPDRVVVDISVNRVIRRSDGELIMEASSVAIGPSPALGAMYRVEAYRGNPGGKPRLFVNLCGGSLRRWAAEPPASPGWAPGAATGASAIFLMGLAIVLRRRSDHLASGFVERESR
jgi:hypothetical protein